MSFPRYPKYKDSGVEWLGEVPEHWETKRGDAFLDTSRNTVEAMDLAGKQVFHYSIPIVQEKGDGQYEDGTEIDSSKLIVSEPQVLVSKLNPRKGTVCVASPKNILTVCSGEFVPLIPRRGHLRFVLYLVQTDNYKMRLESLVESATRSHQRVLPSDVLKFRWALPSLSEQAGIAAFLDQETWKIDALVVEQQRLIELLKEKRLAVISHAVTKGLKLDVPMKPSGIEWIGQIPQHWELVRLGYYAKIENGTTPSRENPNYWINGEIPWLSSGEVNQYRITEAGEFITKEALDKCSLRLLPKGTIVIGMIGQGKTRGLSASLEIEASINQNLAAAIPLEDLKSDYLLYIFQSIYEYLREFGRGGNQAALNCEILSAMRMPLPPLTEQAYICHHLERRLSEINTLTTEAQRGIDLLQERRSALISAAVTGKIDVRNALQRQAA